MEQPDFLEPDTLVAIAEPNPKKINGPHWGDRNAFEWFMRLTPQQRLTVIVRAHLDRKNWLPL